MVWIILSVVFAIAITLALRPKLDPWLQLQAPHLQRDKQLRQLSKEMDLKVEAKRRLEEMSNRYSIPEEVRQDLKIKLSAAEEAVSLARDALCERKNILNAEHDAQVTERYRRTGKL